MATSAHLRRLRSRVARTAARFVAHASRERLDVAELATAKLPWYEIRNESGVDPYAPDEVATVLLFDEIGGSFGVDAATFAEDLAAVTAPLIHLRINSPGGSVFDAIAISSALRHHPARVVAYVDALAASAASIVAIAGDEVVMMPGSQMMIHDASAVEDGNAEDMAKMSTFLDRQSNNIADLYRQRGGGDVAQWRELMRAETWMFADEAVDLGLADRVEPVTDDVAADEQMTRSHDLSQFRYAGRSCAPAPRRAARPPNHRGGSSGRQPDAAARQRAAAGPAVPVGDARSLAFPAQHLRAQLVERNGRQVYRVDGYASVVEQPYEMWDMHGPYQEVISRNAFDKTLAAAPDVAFLVNHRGVTMARSTNGTLELSADATGLRSVAYLNADRQDVRDLVSAISDGLITEMSFAFMLEDGGGAWSDDLQTFRINQVDIDRGDVSAVTYGANPYTSIAARQREILSDLDHLPAGAARAALARLQHREDLAPVRTSVEPASPEPSLTGRSLTQIDAWIATVQAG